MDGFSSSAILDRLKVALSVKTDSALALAIGISAAVLSNWRRRNYLDIGLVYPLCDSVDMDWLLTGRERKAVSEDARFDVVAKSIAQAEEIGILRERLRWVIQKCESDAIFHE